MATIKEIAELAGVSRGTVDRVLNNRGAVNPATEEKIREIAKALDYRPNRAGLVLAAQKKNLKLGVILFSQSNPFFEDVLKGVRNKAEELAEYNCCVLIREVHFNVEEQLDAINELVEIEEISGLAIAPYNDPRISDKINRLWEKGIPTVTLNTDIENSSRIAYVGSNYTRSGETAAGLMHLLTYGEVNLGVISGSPKILCHTERIAGFENKIKKEYPNIHITGTVVNNDDDFESYDQTLELLRRYPEINALFFAAGGVYGGCRAVMSLHREKKITILAFDKVPTTKELVQEGIIAATICQQPRTQGSKPLDILFAYLTTGVLPEKENHYVSIDIRIKENL
ncbi:MAG: LacI family DNA-binding transcriptional regulator [Lachnospiraceae bacterium]|nr:LacI family DNA-binding transcriptional regulator [Lachnospiraceae bacterium]